MIIINNTWIEKNQLHMNLNISLPDVQLSIDGAVSNLNPPSQTINFVVANVSFGKASLTSICDWSQITYDESKIEKVGNGIDIKLKELLDIKWYRCDQIHMNDQSICFKQGYIASDKNEPITLRFNANTSSSDLVDIGFQYGDIISLHQVITGDIGNDLTLNQHWWSYITTLLARGIFKTESLERINNHILGVFEKHAFNIKG